MDAIQPIIDELFREIKAGPNPGAMATYIPELAHVNPQHFAVSVIDLQDRCYGAGEQMHPFSIQSIAKVLSLSLAFNRLGDSLWQRVGVEPAGTPFNSLSQLENDHGIPRNPFINAGALVVCDMLISRFEDTENHFLDFLRQLSGNQKLDFNHQIAESERAHGQRNSALAYYLKSFGNLNNEAEKVLDFYFKLCSITMSTQELAETFLYLGNRGIHPRTGQAVLNPSQTKRINALMQTCGFYDQSGDFSFRVGLPGKSGVGGGILAIYPGKYSIGVWSPRLNDKGNSWRGVKFLEHLTTQLADSIF
jgi:glutaminase